MAKLAPFGPFRGTDADNKPIAGGKLYTYEARTSTHKATYTDSSENTLNPNPVILDSQGYPESGGLWLGVGAYKLILKDADDVDVWPVPLDDIGGESENAFGSQVVQTDSNLVVTEPYRNSAIIGTDALSLLLVPAEEAGSGFYFSVKNNGNGEVKVEPDGTETIDGGNEKIILPGRSALVITDGVEWFTLFGSADRSEVTIPSAAITDLGVANGNTALITGTTAITSFGNSASLQAPIFYVRFSDALTLTHGAALQMPASANRITANGDSLTAQYLGSGNWKVLEYNSSTDVLTPLAALAGHVLSGFTLSNNATDAANDIDIAPGWAVSDDGTTIIHVSSAITKRLDAAWAVGSGNGGLDTGAIANTDYHLWAIQRPDTGVVDVLFSTSATAPTMPANYTKKARLGAIIRSSGAILGFVQNGDKFTLKAPFMELNTGTQGTSATTITLSAVPKGIKVEAMLGLNIFNGSVTALLISDLDVTDIAPAATGGGKTTLTVGVANDRAGGEAIVTTNTAGQFRSRAGISAISEYTIYCNGWIDRRGK